MIAIIVKATIVLAAAFAAAALLRRRSAALRHFLWTAALGALLLLPALTWMPRMTVAQPVFIVEADTTVVRAAHDPAPPRAEVPWLGIFYGLGLLAASAR